MSFDSKKFFYFKIYFTKTNQTDLKNFIVNCFRDDYASNLKNANEEREKLKKQLSSFDLICKEKEELSLSVSELKHEISLKTQQAREVKKYFNSDF